MNAQQSDKIKQTSIIRSSYQREDVYRNEKHSSIKDSIIVSGQVLDEISNEILIGASVYVKGKNFAKVTDVDGKFTFTIDEMNFPENDSLLIIYTGYNKKEIKINPDYKTELKILMSSLPLEYGLIGLVEYKCSPKFKWWQWNKKRLFNKDSKH